MKRKKRKRRDSYTGKDVAKRPKAPFNPLPESCVALKRLQAGPVAARPVPPAPEIIKDDEDCVFLAAMKGVRPIGNDAGRFVPPPRTDMRPPRPAPDDELEAMAHLSDLVNGQVEMDITFSDEYIEGCVKGFSLDLMRRLRTGRFPVQAYLDLHGLTKQEAELRVKDFLMGSYRIGRRCVLLIHGRGLNSTNNIPVLKERIPVWLARGSVRKIVLAFSTARPYDGGTGAVYVLIKKQRVRQ